MRFRPLPSCPLRILKNAGCSLAALLTTLVPAIAQTESASEIPLVYSVENTGANFPAPSLPDIADLPVIHPLTDPFSWSDEAGRSTNFKDWARRRAQIKAEIEHYEIGAKPGRPEDITASYANNVLTVDVTVNGETLSLTSEVILPSGPGPFPAIIGIGRGSGSLPPEIFSERNVAQIAFDFTQVMSHTQTRGEEPINRLYPDQVDMGAYSAWPWGVSRLIDGLELVQEKLPVDLAHLAVSGCSFAGKMALFVGAFDERIALTIAQEPGGGGAAAWRVSETLGEVEKLGRTNYAWFKESMRQFAGGNVSKLPMDHHELMAMVAPRALFILGNTDYTWLAEESGYVSCRAAHKVWQTLGISDRFGFSIVGGHPHCRVPDSQKPEVAAFVDKFLLGIEETNTEITTHPFPEVDYARWTDWWEAGDPIFALRESAHTISLEVENGNVGADWMTEADDDASNGKYVTTRAGAESLEDAPTGSEGAMITLPFTVDADGRYAVLARLNNAGNDSDSLWVKVDDGDFLQRNGLRTDGWEWLTLNNYRLSAGEHTITIGYRENGARLDTLRISTYPFAP